MERRPWFWLYRPTAPSVRAQSIQVVHMAHAMASRGHEVTLAVDPPAEGRALAEDLLAFYGLEPHEDLHLVVLPTARTAASLAFRALFAAWVARTRGRGIVYARSKRYAREAIEKVGKRFRLIVEAHEVDSLQLAEKGLDDAPMRALEAFVLSHADGVVTNCPGTLELLRRAHPTLPPAAAFHNGTHRSRIRRPDGRGEGVGYVGSMRDYKDVACLARAAAEVRLPVCFVGADADSDDGRELQRLAGGRLQLEPPLPHKDVPDRLCRFRVLVLPLGRGLFGERLTSPLKLWDYLASGVPIVGADVPSLHDAAPGAFLAYPPGDSQALANAIATAAADEVLRRRLLGAARVRTWDDRAAEVERFVESVA